MIDLYRFHDATGRLLYVGISLHTAVRIMDHKRDKSWWPEVASITIEHLDVSRYDALRIERRAIHFGDPVYNIAGTASTSAAPKFACTSCGKRVQAWGFVMVQLDPSTPNRVVAAHRLAAEIADAETFDSWRVEHGDRKCATAFDETWVVLDVHDVWALHVGARPAFARVAKARTRHELNAAWESGEL